MFTEDDDIVRFAIALAIIFALTATASRAAGQATVEVLVVPCASLIDTAPTLTIRTTEFKTVKAVPRWTKRNGAFVATVVIPEGHYILRARYRRHSCTAGALQFVALAGFPRHLLVTFAKGDVFTIDENMHAGAIYGTLPSADASVEVIVPDSPVADETRRAGSVDGRFFEVAGLHGGQYLLRLRIGHHVVTRVVALSGAGYGRSVRVDLRLDTMEALVRASAAESRFVERDGITKYETPAIAIDGWQFSPTPFPADYVVGHLRISRDVFEALEAAQRWLASSAAGVYPDYAKLSAWHMSVSGSAAVMVVTLQADNAPWPPTDPRQKGAVSCSLPEHLHSVNLTFDRTSWNVLETFRCP